MAFYMIGFVLIGISVAVRQQKQKAQAEVESINESQEYEGKAEDYLRRIYLATSRIPPVPLVDPNQRRLDRSNCANS